MQYGIGNSSQAGPQGHCPWCGNDALGFWEKQTLGPLVPKRCHHCSHYVRASWPSTLGAIALVLVPFVAGLAYSETAGLADAASLLVKAAGLVVGAAAAMAWHRRYLRLLPHAGRVPPA